MTQKRYKYVHIIPKKVRRDKHLRTNYIIWINVSSVKSLYKMTKQLLMCDPLRIAKIFGILHVFVWVIVLINIFPKQIRVLVLQLTHSYTIISYNCKELIKVAFLHLFIRKCLERNQICLICFYKSLEYESLAQVLY